MTITDLPASTSRSSRASSCVDVGEVQAGWSARRGRRYRPSGHLGGQLEALTLATGQRGQRLAEPEVAEPDVGHAGRGSRAPQASLAAPLPEERRASATDIAEHLADVVAAEQIGPAPGLESLAAAVLTRRGHRLHEPELGVDDAVAVAGRAGSFGVGAEERRLDAVGLRERLADRVEQSGVGGGVAAP